MVRVADAQVGGEWPVEVLVDGAVLAAELEERAW